MAVEYFTFPGNGEIVHGVMNAVATLSGSSAMTSAAQAAALFGFLVMLCVAVYKLDLRDSFISLFVFAAVWMSLMVPKTSVLITESAGYGYTGRQYVVGNVPVGLAWAGNIVSSFGMSMTRKMEQIYTIPNDLNYSRTGMLFGSRLIEDIRSAKIQDATLTQDWALFMNQCSFFDMNMYRFYSITDVQNSTDILATLGKTNQAMFTNVSDATTSGKTLNYSGGSTAMPCNQAYAMLKNRTNFYIQNNLISKISQRVFNGLGAENIVNRNSALATLGNTSFQYLLNNSRFDTLKNIEQSAMVEMIREASVINAQRNHNNAIVQKVFTFAQSRNQYIAAQKNGAMMASWNLPLVRSAIEAVLIGLFPLVILIGLMSGVMAFRTLMFYFGGLLWVQLWAPVASVMNYVLTINTKRLLSLEATSGMITPGSADNLLMAAADAQAAAGATLWLIPVIAGALALGGRTLMNGMMGMATGAKSGAEAAGSQTGKGNYDGGNMSYNNVNSNKYNPNPIYSDPQMLTAQNAAGTGWTTMARNGESRYQARNSSLAVSSQSQISESENYGRMADRSETAARQHQAAYQESLALGQAQTLAWAGKHSMGQSADSGYGMGLDATQSHKWSQVMKAADDIAQKHGISEGSAVRSQLAGQLGLNIPGVKLGGGWSGTATNESKLSADIAKAAKALREEGVTFDSSFTDKVSSSAAYKTSLASGDELAQGASASMQHAQQASRSAVDSFNEAQSYREQAQRTYGNGKTVTYDNTNDLIANNPNLTLSQLNSGEGNTFQTAISTADRRSSQMDTAARAEGWNSADGLTPDSRPLNTVDSSYQRNVSSVSGASHAAFEGVRELAARNGIRADSVDAAISKRGHDYEQDFNHAQRGVAGQVEQGGQRYDGRVDDLANQARQADKNSNGALMELNTHLDPLDTRKREQIMQDVRDGKGNLGSGANQTEAHLGRNPNLASDFKRPGSGSRTFRPKQ